MSRLSKTDQLMLLGMFVAGILFGYFDVSNHNMDNFGVGYALGSGIGYCLLFVSIPWLFIIIIRGILRFWGDRVSYRWPSIKLALRIGFFICVAFTLTSMLSWLSAHQG